MRSFDFRGRARRSDILYWWLATAAATLLSDLALDRAIDDHSVKFFGRTCIDAILTLPLFALLARRLHDFGRTGWWAMMAPPLLAAGIYNKLRADPHFFAPGELPTLGIWSLPLVLAALLVLATVAAPGDAGPNRYGPDPRLEPEPEGFADDRRVPPAEPAP